MELRVMEQDGDAVGGESLAGVLKAGEASIREVQGALETVLRSVLLAEGAEGADLVGPEETEDGEEGVSAVGLEEVREGWEGAWAVAAEVGRMDALLQRVRGLQSRDVVGKVPDDSMLDEIRDVLASKSSETGPKSVGGAVDEAVRAWEHAMPVAWKRVVGGGGGGGGGGAGGDGGGEETEEVMVVGRKFPDLCPLSKVEWDDPKRLPCGHAFNHTALRQFVRRRLKCPECAKPFQWAHVQDAIDIIQFHREAKALQEAKQKALEASFGVDDDEEEEEERED